ncbi:MAG: hypothetical protein OXD42_07845 [Rhodospirillaceae bacterium]|nr:hypothetical protein [Rhodospirillaceae bacterium]
MLHADCRRSIPNQRRLDAMEILNHGREVDARVAQIAVSNLIADLVKLQDPFPLFAVSVENQHQTVPETQSRVFLVVRAPRPAAPPVIVGFPMTDRVAAGIVDIRFQLAPRQHEIRLLVQLLPAFDTVAILATVTAKSTTSAGRLSPLGPLGMVDYFMKRCQVR